MDRKAIRMVLLLALLAASIPHLAASATTVSPVTVGTPDSDQWFPVVSGDRIAWLDYRGSTGEIYLYDILTGEERRISPEGAMCESPDISGDRMVWRVWNESYGGYDLDVYDLSAGEHTIIASGSVDHGNPAIDGTRVVWDDMRAGNSSIYLYDLSTGLETQITSDQEEANNPAISGDRIVWQSCDPGDCDLYLYDLATGKKAKRIGSKPEYQSSPVIDGPIIAWQNGPYGSSDISYLNLDTDETGTITSGGSASNPPAISGDRIVWEDIRNGNTDIYLYNTTSREELRVTDDPNEQVSPSIDGDRVVWTDYRNGMADIYLGTLQTTLTVPVAAFSADPTIGGSPLTVQFTDESTGDPTTWHWDFGDGETSTDQHPSHTYASAGTYSVSLTISNPVGRSMASLPDSIHSGSGPTASFTATPTAGLTPLTVQFTDTSTGSPDAWSWDFGDGETSSLQHPSHTYQASGRYSVSLTAGNLFGETSTTLATPVEVLNGTRVVASTEINGLTVMECGGSQCVYVDPTAFSSFLFDPAGDPALLSAVPPPASGWSRITLQARTTGFSDMGDGTLTGTLTDVMLESLPIIPSTFSPQTGQDLEITYALNLSRYPVLATVDTTVWENVTTADHPRFLQAAYDANYASITAVAYTMDFSSVNVSSVRSATLNLSAMSSWVALYGSQGNMTLLRLDDDGSRQGFKYEGMVSDPATGLDHYRYVSPKGLSRFALASVSGSGNPFQLLVLSAGTRASTGKQTGHSSNDFPEGFPTSAPRSVQPLEPLIFQETGRPEMTESGLTTRPLSIISADQGASLTIAADTRLTNDQGLPPQEISVLMVSPYGITPPAGSTYTYSGVSYDMQPDGLVFDPSAEVQFQVDPARWQNSARYQVLSRRDQADPWEAVPTRQDDTTRTVTATVTHFSLHALFSEPVPVTTPPRALPTLQAAPEPAAPKAVPRTPLATITGVIFWTANTAQGHVPEFLVTLLLVGGIAFTLRRGVPVRAFRPWVFLYLVSLSAYLWATFQALTGGSLWVSSWIFLATAGLNLIVHFLRFDRIILIPTPGQGRAGYRL